MTVKPVSIKPTPRPKRIAWRKSWPMTAERARLIEELTEKCHRAFGYPRVAPAQTAQAQEPVLSEKELIHWRRRLVAELIAMPAICPVRQCRRLGRCLIEEAECLGVHRLRAGHRVNVMLGWDACALIDDDEEDDSSW